MIEKIKVTELSENKGQIKCLPANPRFIKDEKFEKLKQSLQDDPEMLELRELLVFKHNNKFVVIGGNMRYKAALELGIKELPCKIIPPETPVEKLKAYTIKDNVSYGEYEWDMLNEDWNLNDLSDWGMDLPIEESDIDIDNFFNENENVSEKEKEEKLLVIIPNNYNNLKEEIKVLIEDAISEYSGIRVK